MGIKFVKFSFFVSLILFIATGCKEKKINAEGFGGGNLVESAVQAAILRLVTGLSKMLQGQSMQYVCDYRYSAESNLVNQQLKALHLGETQLTMIQNQVADAAYIRESIVALTNAQIRVVPPGPLVTAYGSIQKAVTSDGTIYINEDTFPSVTSTELLSLLRHETDHLLNKPLIAHPTDFDSRANCTAVYVNATEGMPPSGNSENSTNIVFQDNFNRANSSNLGASWTSIANGTGSGWLGSGSGYVVNNMLSAPSDFYFENRVAGLSRLNAAISLQLDLRNSPGGYGWIHIHARIQTSTTNNRYALTIGRVNSSIGMNIFIQRSGTWYPLAGQSLPETDPNLFYGELEFIQNGNTLIGKWKGVEKIRITDNEIVNSGSLGIYGMNSVIDDFKIKTVP